MEKNSNSKPDILLNDELKQELCIECQNCCQGYFHVKTAYEYSEDLEKFYTTIGFKTAKWFDDDDDAFLEIAFFHKCVHLSPSGCSIYKVRPKPCSDFDGRNHGSNGWGNVEKCLWNGYSEEKQCINI